MVRAIWWPWCCGKVPVFLPSGHGRCDQELGHITANAALWHLSPASREQLRANSPRGQSFRKTSSWARNADLIWGRWCRKFYCTDNPSQREGEKAMHLGRSFGHFPSAKQLTSAETRWVTHGSKGKKFSGARSRPNSSTLGHPGLLSFFGKGEASLTWSSLRCPPAWRLALCAAHLGWAAAGPTPHSSLEQRKEHLKMDKTASKSVCAALQTIIQVTFAKI